MMLSFKLPCAPPPALRDEPMPKDAPTARLSLPPGSRESDALPVCERLLSGIGMCALLSGNKAPKSRVSERAARAEPVTVKLPSRGEAAKPKAAGARDCSAAPKTMFSVCIEREIAPRLMSVLSLARGGRETGVFLRGSAALAATDGSNAANKAAAAMAVGK